MPRHLAVSLSRTAALAALALGLSTAPALAQRTAQKTPPEPTLEPVAAVWEWLQDAPQVEKDDAQVNTGPGSAAFDALLPNLDRAKKDDLIRAALATRLQAQLATLPPKERGVLVEFLRQHEALASELAFQILPQDDAPAAYRVLARLIEAHGEQVAEFAPLAAAICVVHDQPRPRRVNENSVPLLDAVELFGYFSEHERAMHFSLAETPASQLIFLVDTNGTFAELEWARRYRRDTNIGNRYQEIEYDNSGVTGVKRVTAAGEYTLQKIRELGGICADQAYFAMTVGKANGVPTCYVSGRGGDTSHAWLGFLEKAGRKGARWNFSAGRYASYEDVQGKVREPQTWTQVPDANISIAGYATWFKPEARQHAEALTDAAVRVGVLAWQTGGARAINAGLTERQLDILEQAIRLNPGNVRAWLLARDRLAVEGMPLKQRERWAREIDHLAGQTSPDFAFEMLEPIFNAEANSRVRYNLWDWAATRFGDRQDLPARARVAQVKILIEEDQPAAAYEAARAVFEQYNQGGPIAVEALTLAEQLLVKRGDSKAVLELYLWAFDQLRSPGKKRIGFLQQSTWYQVGTRYLELLDAAGETRRATALRRQLGLSVAPPGR